MRLLSYLIQIVLVLFFAASVADGANALPLGCVKATATGADCSAGMVGAATEQLFVAGLKGPVPPQGTPEYEAWKTENSRNLAFVSSVTGYLTSGGKAENVTAASDYAVSAFQNNYLTGPQRKFHDSLTQERDQLAKACNMAGCPPEVVERLKEISLLLKALDAVSVENTMQMLQACSSGSSACAGHISEAQDYLEWSGWSGAASVSAGYIQKDIDWGGNLDALIVDVYSGVGSNPTALAFANQNLLDRIVKYDGRMNSTVGAASVVVGVGGAVAVCAGTGGVPCLLAGLAGGASVVGSGDTLYDGLTTLATGKAQANITEAALQKMGYSPADASLIHGWIDTGATVVEMAAGGFAVIKSGKMVGYLDRAADGKASVATFDQGVDVGEIVYRGDTRAPDVIFEHGFQPKAPGSNVSLENYVDYNQPSNYVSTTKNTPTGGISAGSPGEFATDGGHVPGYIYEIKKPTTGIDVNKAYPNGPFPYENEIAIPGGVPSNCILGCTPVGSNGAPIGEYIQNPNYTGGN